MADQASMTTRNSRMAPAANGAAGRSSADGAGGSAAYAVVSGVAGLGEDLLDLAELQARMAAIELRQNLNAAKASGAAILAGSILAIASLPVALMGIAELLVSELGLKHGNAFLCTGGVAMLVGVACAGIAAAWLRRQKLGFPLSAEELARNLNWVRTVMRFGGRTASRR
jgi:hypothetical protein